MLFSGFHTAERSGALSLACLLSEVYAQLACARASRLICWSLRSVQCKQILLLIHDCFAAIPGCKIKVGRLQLRSTRTAPHLQSNISLATDSEERRKYQIIRISP